MIRRATVLLGLALLWLAACTTGERGSAADDSFTLASPSDGTKSITPPATRSIRGVLTFDDIEGGCAYLESDDGTRFEVIYPAGWRLDRAAAILRGPADVVVRAGETVTVNGSIATDRSSICQVGPIFRAETVEISAG